MITFRVFGEPAPQGSKCYVGNNRFIEASTKLKPWREAVKRSAIEAFESARLFPFQEAVVVEVVFHMPKPKTVKRLWPTVPPDTDKLCRSLGDGLSVDAAVISDDSLIVKWIATKIYSHEPGAVVRIRLATDNDLETVLEIDLTQADYSG
jgi:Holliday junction resolvase RusA-like endonuclease